MRYTLVAGRVILRDDKPFCSIHGEGDYRPTEIDRLAVWLVSLLNLLSTFREGA